jgi:hypothetical protein
MEIRLPVFALAWFATATATAQESAGGQGDCSRRIVRS